MLEAWREAYNHQGPSQSKIGHEAAVRAKTIGRWSKGLTRCPEHKRACVDRAMGKPVDWDAYDLEFDGKAESPPPVDLPPEQPDDEFDALLKDAWGDR